MKPEPPIILSAFANNQAQPLRLAEEERAIREALAIAHDQRRIEFTSLGHSTLNDIYSSFNRFHNRIAIFHYGGHSDQQFLHLEDTHSRAGSLSKLMGMQGMLKMVFLNGCGNRDHVASLFKKGVKVVIATSCSIEDQRAQQFAAQFYQALAAGKSIRESFDTAVSFIGNKYPDLEMSQTRGIVFKFGAKEELPWGLYSQNDADLEWIIPEAVTEPENLDYFEKVRLDLQDINKELVLRTFEGMAKYDEEYEDIHLFYQQKPTDSRFNHLQNTMVDAFPSILSTQIRDLFTPEGRFQGRLRLVEINEAYLTLVRVLSSIALSNLWDTAVEMQKLHPGEGLYIREEYLQELRDFMEITPAVAEDFDYLWLVGTISRIMIENKVKPYVKEMIYLNQGFREADDYYEAYRFLETQIRQRLKANNISSAEVEGLCIEAEIHLGNILHKCAFLCTYQMVTVKDISVNLPRPSPEPTFIHSKAILKGRDYATIDSRPIHRQSYVSNNSVFLTRNIQDEDPPLNLSPFIIDESAFKNKEEHLPKIFFYFGKEGEDLHYQHAEILSIGLLIQAQYDKRVYHGLENVFQQLAFFRKIIGV